MLLNKQNLAVAEFASKEEWRYTLTAIRVDHNGTAATNGNYAVKVTLAVDQKDECFPCPSGFTPTNGSTQPFLLHSEDAKRIAKALPRKPSLPILANAAVGLNAENKLAIAVNDIDTPLTFSPRKVDGKFPDLESCQPTGEPILTIGLNAKYLAQLAKAAAAFGDGERAIITFKAYGPDKAITMEVSDSYTGQKWFAMLMPCQI